MDAHASSLCPLQDHGHYQDGQHNASDENQSCAPCLTFDGRAISQPGRKK